MDPILFQLLVAGHNPAAVNPEEVHLVHTKTISWTPPEAWSA